MYQNYTLLLQEAYPKMKNAKAPHFRSTFGGQGVEKRHFARQAWEFVRSGLWMRSFDAVLKPRSRRFVELSPKFGTW